VNKVLAGAVALALLTIGCGDSDSAADCWAERQALVAEIAAVPTMSASALAAAYGTSGSQQQFWLQQDRNHVQAWLAKQLPDC